MRIKTGLAGLALWAGVAAAVAAAPEVLENSLGMKFVRVPAGEFTMGSDATPQDLAQRFPHYDLARLRKIDDEAPAHRVRISRDFYLGQHEVTVGQFRRFVARSGHIPESIADHTGAYGYNRDYDPDKTVRGDAFEGRDPKYSWTNPGFKQGDDEPVVNVSWNDAVAMAKWLSAQETRHYRLPTEAEWEYVCRAGTNTIFPNGDDPAALPEIANTFDADAAVNWPRWQDYALREHDGYAFTAPVGSFAPNGFGVYDMVGNVWEWVSDWYGADSYGHSPPADPQGPPSGSRYVRRGGAWHSWSLYARCGFRNWNPPESRYTLLGIRLLFEVSAGKP
jgi:formylglycine-generating enzyme